MIQSVTDAAASVEMLVSQAADEFAAALARGERPTVAEFAARYPEIANLLRQVLPTIEAIGNLSPEGDADDATTAPKNLGDFLIEREIGRGGMGVVYRAKQISLGRTVALKVLPFAGVLDEKQLQRFKNEARAAATLEHPHIVPVYSVGCERGVHFFAMRFIDGQSLAEILQAIPGYKASQTEGQSEVGDRKSDARGQRLNVGSRKSENNVSRGTCAVRSPSPVTGEGWGEGEEAPIGEATARTSDLRPPNSDLAPDTRPNLQALISTDADFHGPAYLKNVARLGIQAAEALAYAHEQGILHRDIKPGNLLLDLKGDLWVADFGLARLEQDAGLTITGDMMGTLRYMSPEQALGQRVLDERSDVYSLGITLYELLVLRPAFSGRNRQQILGRIAVEDPKPPRQINPRIPRNLETIVLKAISKEPIGRYQNAQQLAEDLRNFLAKKPIKAKPPTWRERLVKWSRCHPGMLVSAVIVAVVIAVASAIAAAFINVAKDDAIVAQKKAFDLANEKSKLADDERQSWERAVQQSELALKTLNLVVNDIQSKLPNVAGARDLRRRLLSTAIAGLKQVSRTLNTAAKADHTLVQSHLELGDTFLLTGDSTRGSATEDAREQFQSANEIALKLVELDPKNVQTQRDLALSYQGLARANELLGNAPVACDYCQKFLEISRKLVQDAPQNARAQLDLAEWYLRFAELKLSVPSGDASVSAHDAYQKATDIIQKLAQVDPSDNEARRDIWLAYTCLGFTSLDMGNAPAARDAYKRALQISEAMVHDSPKSAEAHLDLAFSYNGLAQLSAWLGDATAAREACQKSIEIREMWTSPASYDFSTHPDLTAWCLVDFPGAIQAQHDLAQTYARLGGESLRLGNTSAAQGAYRKSLEAVQKFALEDPHNGQAQLDVAEVYGKLGNLSSRVRDMSAARDAFRKDLEIRVANDDPRFAAARRDLALAYHRFGQINLDLGNVTIAHDAFLKADEISQRFAHEYFTSATSRHLLIITYSGLANMNLKLDNMAATRDACTKALNVEMKPTDYPDETPVRILWCASISSLADVSLQLGEVSEARDFVHRERDILFKFANSRPQNTQAQIDLARCYGRLGDMEVSAEDFAAAARWFEQGIAILEKLNKDGTIAGQPDNQALLQEQMQALAVCKAAPQAIDSLEFALGQPREIVSELLGVRSRALARRGQSQEAAATADKLGSLEFADGRDLFHAAVGIVLCADGVRAAQRQAKPSTDDKVLEDRYATRSVELLKRAQAKGYFKDPVQRAALAADHNLDPLCPRDDFQKLVSRVWDQSDPSETDQSK